MSRLFLPLGPPPPSPFFLFYVWTLERGQQTTPNCEAMPSSSSSSLLLFLSDSGHRLELFLLLFFFLFCLWRRSCTLQCFHHIITPKKKKKKKKSLSCFLALKGHRRRSWWSFTEWIIYTTFTHTHNGTSYSYPPWTPCFSLTDYRRRHRIHFHQDFPFIPFGAVQ